MARTACVPSNERLSPPGDGANADSPGSGGLWNVGTSVDFSLNGPESGIIFTSNNAPPQAPTAMGESSYNALQQRSRQRYFDSPNQTSDALDTDFWQANVANLNANDDFGRDTGRVFRMGLLSSPTQGRFPDQNSSIDPTVLPATSNSPSRPQPPISQPSSTLEWMPETYGLLRGHRDYKEANANLLHVVDSLGHGSLGVVEEVRVSVMFPSFVRKRVRIPFNQRTRYLDIIKQESQMLQDLSHRHIVKMLGTYAETPENSIGRQFYSLLMTPVGERDLKTFLEMFDYMSTPEPVRLINYPRVWLQTWFKCLSSALAYLHSQGVRHQDIKPSNIIHRGSEIYFTDFSSASCFQIGQTTSTENPARTSAMYAAPEVIDNDDMINRHGRGTDVFALGAVFTEMLAVLQGYSIEEYHGFLASSQSNDSSGRPSSPLIPRQTLRYGRKLEQIAVFFGNKYRLYNNCIALMLRVDRKSRPDAEAVAETIREELSWWALNCPC